MPTVLITGINGFVAVHTAVQYLENGWNVRGTVRSKEKGDKALALPCFKQYKEKINYVIVEDLIKGDFSEALKGVDAIAHCASPWHFNGKKWSDYRDPAVEGTSNILEQAAKIDSVKNCAIISSFAAVGDCLKPYSEQKGRVYTENDWLPQTEKDCEEAEKNNHPMAPVMWYCASKKFAEIAAFETQKRVSAKYTLAAINPPMILGPAIHYADAQGLDKSDVSTSSLYAALAAGKDASIPDTSFTAWADVRNVAFGLYAVNANGKNGRFSIYDGDFDWELLAKEARQYRPDLDASIPNVPKDKQTPVEQGTYTIDTSKAEKELGFKRIPREKMVKDTLAQLETLGAFRA